MSIDDKSLPDTSIEEPTSTPHAKCLMKRLGGVGFFSLTLRASAEKPMEASNTIMMAIPNRFIVRIELTQLN